FIQYFQLLRVNTLQFGKVGGKFDKAKGIVIPYCGISRSLVSNVHLMTLVCQTDEGTPHGDDIVIRMWRKDDRTLPCRIPSLWPLAIIRVGLTPGPTRNGMLQLIENIDVNTVHGAFF